jgi:hypothetical protein
MSDLHDLRSVELERAVTDATIHCAEKENTITDTIQHNSFLTDVSDCQRMEAHVAASDP